MVYEVGVLLSIYLLGRRDRLWPAKTVGESDWFLRGWTLQELIAPHDPPSFCGSDWRTFGTKKTLECKLNSLTGIPLSVLAETGGDVAVLCGSAYVMGSRSEDN